MRSWPAATLYAVSLALLAAEWSGMHTHIDDHGFRGAAQGMQGHHHHGHDGSHDPNSNEELDVRIVDYGLSVSKVFVFAFALGLTLFLLPPSRGGTPFTLVTRLILHRRARWRPPLRGPPPAPLAH